MRAAAEAQQIVAEARPSLGSLSTLAIYRLLLLRLQGRRRRRSKEAENYANTKFERENLDNELERDRANAPTNSEKQLAEIEKEAKKAQAKKANRASPTRSAKATRSAAAVVPLASGPRRTRTFNLELKRLLL